MQHRRGQEHAARAWSAAACPETCSGRSTSAAACPQTVGRTPKRTGCPLHTVTCVRQVQAAYSTAPKLALPGKRASASGTWKVMCPLVWPGVLRTCSLSWPKSKVSPSSRATSMPADQVHVRGSTRVPLQCCRPQHAWYPVLVSLGAHDHAVVLGLQLLVAASVVKVTASQTSSVPRHVRAPSLSCPDVLMRVEDEGRLPARPAVSEIAARPETHAARQGLLTRAAAHRCCRASITGRASEGSTTAILPLALSVRSQT